MVGYLNIWVLVSGRVVCVILFCIFMVRVGIGFRV